MRFQTVAMVHSLPSHRCSFSRLVHQPPGSPAALAATPGYRELLESYQFINSAVNTHSNVALPELILPTIIVASQTVVAESLLLPTGKPTAAPSLNDTTNLSRQT